MSFVTFSEDEDLTSHTIKWSLLNGIVKRHKKKEQHLKYLYNAETYIYTIQLQGEPLRYRAILILYYCMSGDETIVSKLNLFHSSGEKEYYRFIAYCFIRWLVQNKKYRIVDLRFHFLNG